MTTTPSIHADIAGQRVSRGDILRWEAKRLPKAAAKIGLTVPAGNLPDQRTAFTDAKLALGAAEIRRRLIRDIHLASSTSRIAAYCSSGRRSQSVCELHTTNTVGAAEFADWFSSTARPDYTRSMIAASPDHFLIDTAEDGRQEVIETTGGSPFANRFFIDFDDTTSLITPVDPIFPVSISGVARTAGGLAIGGVRHQFRDTPTGLHARLLVEFPRLTPAHLVHQHNWHLGCEFANWIETATSNR